MEKPKFEFYERPNGHNEFLEFLENLPQKDQAKLMAVIYKVQIHGLSFDRKWEIIFKELYTFTGKEVVISLLMDLVKKHRRHLEKRFCMR